LEMAAREAHGAGGEDRQQGMGTPGDMTGSWSKKPNSMNTFTGPPADEDLTADESGTPSERAVLTVPGFMMMEVPVDTQSRPVLSAVYAALVTVVAFAVVSIGLKVAEVMTIPQALYLVLGGIVMASMVFWAMLRGRK